MRCPTCHQHHTGKLTMLFVDIDENELPPGRATESSDQVIDDISECLKQAGIGEWPVQQTEGGSAAKHSIIERIKELRAELGFWTERCKSLETSRNELTGKCGRLEVDLDASTARINRLNDNLRIRDNECKIVESKVSLLQSKVSTLEDQHEQMEKQQTAAKRDLGMVRTRCNNLQRELDAIKRKFEESQQTLATTETQLFDLKTSAVGDKAQDGKAQLKIRRQNTQINSLKKLVAEMQSKLDKTEQHEAAK
ncbi:hypothetical protein LPJ70_001878 [Coemansia sp. RSA 2708]|nr:hypothetical protein LPJ70_001878 [Coemansia sp. RSA 2708]